jgi:hypothetical protein
MQDQPSDTPEAPPAAPPKVIPPLKAFAIVMLIGAAGGAFLYTSRPQPAPSATPVQLQTTAEDFSLTDAEAIATFTDLLERSYDAVAARDASMLSGVVTNGSLDSKARGVIRNLIERRTLDKTQYTILNVSIEGNSGDEILLLVETIFEPCFESESGEDLTDAPARLRRKVVWTMVLEDARWLIDNATARSEKVVNDAPASC